MKACSSRPQQQTWRAMLTSTGERPDRPTWSNVNLERRDASRQPTATKEIFISLDTHCPDSRQYRILYELRETSSYPGVASFQTSGAIHLECFCPNLICPMSRRFSSRAAHRNDRTENLWTESGVVLQELREDVQDATT